MALVIADPAAVVASPPAPAAPPDIRGASPPSRQVPPNGGKVPGDECCRRPANAGTRPGDLIDIRHDRTGHRVQRGKREPLAGTAGNKPRYGDGIDVGRGTIGRHLVGRSAPKRP